MKRIEQIKEWLQSQPKDTFLNYALAIEYIAEQNDGAAESILERLIEENPEYYATYYHLGLLKERKGQDDLAIEIYKNGMKICAKIGNKHAFSELKSVLENLEI